MWCSSSPGRALGRLLGWLSLACWLGACSTDLTGIGVGLPSADTNTGAYLLDTITVRASTVLRDSINTSASSYLLLGRARDRQLGTLTATSFFEVTLSSAFVPASNAVMDSVVLRLIPDPANYRYGDTTVTQSLAPVYPLDRPLPANGALYITNKYTDLPALGIYNPSPGKLLNWRRNGPGSAPVIPKRRLSPGLTVVRIRLEDALGSQLLEAGKANQLQTQDQLQTIIPGFAVAPDASDQGALIRFLSTSGDAGLLVYYHDPVDPTTAQSFIFPLGGGRHCFQVAVDPSARLIPGLPLQTGMNVPADRTLNQLVVEGSIGFQTRLEFPYLANLRELGRNVTISGASLTAEVPPSTLEPFIPAPPTLNVLYANASNQPIATYPGSLSYSTATSPVTTLEQGSYTLSLTAYVQAVLSNAVPNNGLLLVSSTPELPNRVILGGPRNPTNPLKARIYVISTN